MVEDAVVNGSSVVEVGILFPEYLDLGKWHRSKERKPGKYPFPSYLMNKKWTMEEEFTKHMLHFQQVTLSSNHFSKLHSDIPGRTDNHRS